MVLIPIDAVGFLCLDLGSGFCPVSSIESFRFISYIDMIMVT